MIRPGVLRFFRLRPRDATSIAAEVDEEIRLHLELRAERLMAAGMTPEAARAEAARRFGGAARARLMLSRRAERREKRMRLREWLGGWRQDLGFSIRALSRERLLSSVVVATLALGIGANAVMFGIVDRLLLSGPRHVADAKQVHRVYVTRQLPGMGERTFAAVGYIAYTALRDETQAFAGVGAYTLREPVVGRGEGARRLVAGYVSWDLFPLLGVRPVLGRFFSADEDQPPRGARVAVADYGYWKAELGAGADVLGREVIVDDEVFTVIGVAPPGFTGPQLREVKLWLPVTTVQAPRPDWPTTRRAQWLTLVVRLKDGIPRASAEAGATATYRAVFDGHDSVDATARVITRPLHYNAAGAETPEVRVTRWLVGVSAIVLLVACANVANLLLARAVRRRREVAVRLALGISRGRLVRLLLSEGLVLAFAGCLAAVAVTQWGGRLVRSMLLPALEASGPVDLRVLGFSALLALFTGLLVGLLPALQAGRQDLSDAMKAGAREGGVPRSRLRNALTVMQAAFSLVLLIGAGLFVHSLWNVRNLQLGIEPDRVLVASPDWPVLITLPVEQQEAERGRRRAIERQTIDALRARPDVEAASLAVGTPFQTSFGVDLAVPGHDSLPRLPGGGPYISAVSDDYFRTVGTRLLEGRAFTAEDRAGSEPVAIVNETMARTLWSGETALGRCLLIGEEQRGGPPPCSRVVGVVEDARRFGLREPSAMQYYVPYGQEVGIGGTTLMIRPRGKPHDLVEAVRRELRRFAPDARMINVTTLQDVVDPQIRPWRLGASMFLVFGLLALTIAGVGLYSLIAYGVARRRAEIGIRKALGARAGNVVRMVMREGLLLVLIGLALGAFAALVGGRFIEPLLFETSSRDVFTFATATGALLVVAVLASLVPAYRAGSIDPAEALRTD